MSDWQESIRQAGEHLAAAERPHIRGTQAEIAHLND